MPVVIPVDHALVSFHTRTTGDPEDMIWTLGVDATAAAQPENLAEFMAGMWAAHIETFTSTVTTLVLVRAKFGPVTTGPTFEESPNNAGTNAGSLPPPNCAVLVQKLSISGGRMNRGRAYLPGISSISGSLDSGGNFSAANALSITTAFNDMRDDMLADAVFGPFAPEILHSGVAAPTPVSQFSCQPKLATQRRRLRP